MLKHDTTDGMSGKRAAEETESETCHSNEENVEQSSRFAVDRFSGFCGRVEAEGPQSELRLGWQLVSLRGFHLEFFGNFCV